MSSLIHQKEKENKRENEMDSRKGIYVLSALLLIQSLFLSESLGGLVNRGSRIVVQKSIYSSRVTKFIMNCGAGRTKHC